MTVREEAELTSELVERLERSTGLRSIGVTDLIAPRRAYHRYFAPSVPIPPARQARLDLGRSVHRALGDRLAGEGVLEARVRRPGIVGRIDILADVPIEMKTASSLVAPDKLVALRPDHLEQLAMYCALVGRPMGRLLTLLSDEGGVADVQALDVAVRAPDRVLQDMDSRAERLRAAWAERRPEQLPRCPWYGRGCEFEEAGVCGCTGEEPRGASSILEEVGPITPRDDVRARLQPIVSGVVPRTAPFGLERFREALYPRRAFFDRARPPTEAPPAPTSEEVPPPAAPDLFARVTEAVESGPPGEVARLPPRSEAPEEEVVGLRGLPLLVRTSRAWARFRPEEVVSRSPQYALDLGLRCAVTGADRAFLVIGFERAEATRDRVQALELRFRDRTPFSRLLRERSQRLAAALRGGISLGLPPCPEWMFADCPYRSECGCGGPG